MDDDDDDDDDDDLRNLLTYDCPLTGRKHIAGEYPDLQTKHLSALEWLDSFPSSQDLRLGKTLSHFPRKYH